MLHRIDVMAGADALFRAITTSEGLAAFWTPASQAEPEVGHDGIVRLVELAANRPSGAARPP